MMVTVAIWYEGRDTYNPLGERNAGGIEVAKESCYGSSKSVPACVCAHSDAPGGSRGRAAARPTLSSSCVSLARALWLLSEGWVPSVEEWEFFSQAIKDLAKMANKRAHWHKLDWRAHTIPSFSSRPWIAVQDKTVTHPAWRHSNISLWHIIKKLMKSIF